MLSEHRCVLKDVHVLTHNVPVHSIKHLTPRGDHEESWLQRAVERFPFPSVFINAGFSGDCLISFRQSLRVAKSSVALSEVQYGTPVALFGICPKICRTLACLLNRDSLGSYASMSLG
jgi:hypothetical protein